MGADPERFGIVKNRVDVVETLIDGHAPGRGRAQSKTPCRHTDRRAMRKDFLALFRGLRKASVISKIRRLVSHTLGRPGRFVAPCPCLLGGEKAWRLPAAHEDADRRLCDNAVLDALQEMIEPSQIFTARIDA